MDFDEYEYLEKTVEEQEDPKKKKDGVSEDKSKRSYRKREGERREDDDEIKSSRKKSKGSRDEDDEERRDRDKERHRRSRDEDDEERRDRDKERHRKSRDEDDEERRDRDKERHRSSRDREREREREKDRDLESSREREREREEERERERRDRSSSRSRRHEKEEERRERSSSRSRRHESDRERDREREIDTRDSRRFKDKKEVVEPEADPERDQRTVFAYQMPLKATERDVYEFFSKAGKLLLGQPVMVKPSEAEKNLVQSNTSGAGAGSVVGPYGAVDRKLYVGNLHFNMTEMQLRQIFEPFGPVELVQLPLDLETGQCKGFGFVQFAQLEHAKAAQGALNGKLEIAGRTIKVSSVTDHVGTQDPAAKSADFDDDEGGLALNAQSRALLMQKLDRSGIATSITSSLGVPLLNGSATIPQAVTLPVNGQVAYPAPVLPPIMCATPLDPIGQPSECLLLKNMFDPATETEPDFDMEIKEDVEEECSKYGRVKHIYVDKNSAGCVYLRFDSIGAAGKAQRAMHMRWFAGRSISALFMQPHEYESRFKG
ncbi:ribonuclease P protein subunit p25-like protein-like [Hibiscus syriacus]|uniref:Ribonuclease P protein subunit p25-like protein-like n=1 Tax=Hibiscus syriacus TaxID=106335 RepID=A0A6A2ZWP6_HIBSY|nr:ribonuclease P protein subunit p25-like protein-like [Hibiscus syriacus]